MYKKCSDLEIADFVNLGNGTWEFCFNITSGISENVFNDNFIMQWSADCILVTNILSYEKIFECLIRDQYSINDEFALINNYLYIKTDEYINRYIIYQNYRSLFKNAISNFLKLINKNGN